MKTRLLPRVKIWGAMLVAVCAAIGGAQAQIVPSLDVGNTAPVFDLLGRPLQGTWNFPETAARVEIRETTGGGGIAPPDPVTGEGNDALNPLVRVTYMGAGVIGDNPGRFSANFPERIDAAKRYYARVYDAPSPSNAVYFANSATFTEVSPDQINVATLINIVFGGLQRVDGTPDVDTDGDGLPDWMEAELGTSPTRPDTDGDGYNDRFEVVHEAYLNRSDLDPAEIRIDPTGVEGEYTASWWAIPGVAYRLEYTDAMTDPEAFVEIRNGTAATTNLSFEVDEWVTNSPMGFFRWTIP